MMLLLEIGKQHTHMQSNLFEQYLKEVFESKHDVNYGFELWVSNLSPETLVELGNKAMEELHNGMNLEISEEQYEEY